MEYSLKTRTEIIIKEATSYKRASKKEKGRIINKILDLIKYNRSYLRLLLRSYGRKIWLNSKGEEIIIVVGKRRGLSKPIRERNRIYGKEVLETLKKIWAIMNFACGKRLQPIISQIVKKLEDKGEILLDAEVRKKLLNISSATIDRILRAEKKDLQLKSRGCTKPGSLLKNQIPIRTFAEWNEKSPGFVELDLVAHDGGNASDDYNYTLNCTDIATGWTEQQAIQNKAQIWVFNALKEIENVLPFKLHGIDSDNGSEFINNHLLRYCQSQKITFTRSRPYRKNDGCFVEQKNWTAVRKIVGYYRYDNDKTLKLLNKLYRYLSLYNNYFQPNMKLIEKTRIGSKVKKKYDIPKTPYQRLLESPFIPKEKKKELKIMYKELNPAELLRNIEKIAQQLIKVATPCNNGILTNKKKII